MQVACGALAGARPSILCYIIQGTESWVRDLRQLESKSKDYVSLELPTPSMIAF